MRPSQRGTPLDTPYTIADVPFSSHPRPLLARTTAVNLNGTWSLSVAKGTAVTAVGEITVPFPPESVASGIGYTLDDGERWVYERTLDIPLADEGQRVILHVDAADQTAAVYINDHLVCEHTGGYTSFSADITAYRTGHDRLLVEVSDPMDPTLPYGKQCRRPHGMWYTPVSGIWQTVWYEIVPQHAIRALRTVWSENGFSLTVEGGVPQKHVVLQTPEGIREYDFTGDCGEIAVPSARRWSPDDPYLYEFTVQSGEDTVSSYTAYRTVSVGTHGGHAYICLNGEPLFIHAVLDQGYYPDGLFLPGNEEGYREDIRRMKALGFNALRKHIKAEPEVFYYECDRQGMLVMQDMVNNGRYRFLRDTALPTVGIKRGIVRASRKQEQQAFLETARALVTRLYEHPSVVYYTIFNEGWGQFSPDTVYRSLRALDPTRIWDATSGWFFGKDSDVQSEHVYFKPLALRGGKRPLVLSEFGGYSCMIPSHSAFEDRPYGYKRLDTPSAFEQALVQLYENEVEASIEQGLCAAVLTQLSDVEEEQNGLLTYDRRVCKVNPHTMQTIGKRLRERFASVCSKGHK